MYARVAVVSLAMALMATLAWQGAQRLLDPARMAGNDAPHFLARPPSDRLGVAGWQTPLLDALEQAVAQGVGGNITAAEMEADRAATILMTSRMRAQTATPEFFEHTVPELDRVLQTHPDNARLVEHVTLARIELAQFRSAQQDLPEASGGSGRAAPKNENAAQTGSLNSGADVGPGAPAGNDVNIPGQVILAAPRALGANELLDPAALHGNYIDATLMPDASEILLPPSTRVMADGVRVDGLTIAGAAQTLEDRKSTR